MTVMDERIKLLRQLVDEVGLATQSDLAKRWGVSKEAVRKFMSDPDCPKPIIDNGSRYYAVPEVDAFRTRKLRRSGRRGGGVNA